ncbi:MAG: hypothetical protein DKT66_18445 [Candidatus Melainabacteria bacterium]|nr:MAG: hypothetical protein DKT66_18445 [Candidatus Melainabacteria bacterium]
MSSSGQTDSVSHPFEISKQILADAGALKRFVDANLLAFVRCDVSGRYWEVNQAMVDLLGYSKEELESGAVKWNDITPQEHSFVDLGAVAELAKNGKAGPFQKELLHKDGSKVPVVVGVVTLPESTDQVLAYLIGLQPKTLYEYRQLLQEAHFQLLAENIPQLVNVCDPEGRIIYSNKRFVDYTGLKHDQEEPLIWNSCVHPADVKLMQDLGEKCGKDRSIFECEARLRAKDGSYRWHLILSVPIFNADGVIREWFGTSTDIDDKKRQQDEIRESELRFRMLADAIPQIVWSADASGNFTFFNHRWTEFTGLSVEQSLNDAWTLLIHPDDLPIYLSEWNKALSSGDSYEVEFRLKRAIGVGKVSGNPYRWHLGRAVALRSRTGSIVEWFGTWTEIEPQKRRSAGK